MCHSYYIIVIIIFIMTTIICKTNNQMKADVKLNKLAKLQLHMLNVRQTTALTVRHYANVMLWLKFLPMGLKGLSHVVDKHHIYSYTVSHEQTPIPRGRKPRRRSIKVLVINHTISCPLGWHHIYIYIYIYIHKSFLLSHTSKNITVNIPHKSMVNS